MNTKLTLTIKKNVIEKAKDYAKNKNRSLSDIVENYLKLLTREEQEETKQNLNPVVASLKGSFKTSENLDYKKELQKRLEKKYL